MDLATISSIGFEYFGASKRIYLLAEQICESDFMNYARFVPEEGTVRFFSVQSSEKSK